MDIGEVPKAEVLDMARLINEASINGELRQIDNTLVFPFRPGCSEKAEVYFVVKRNDQGKSSDLANLTEYLPQGSQIKRLIESPQSGDDILFRAAVKNSVNQYAIRNLGDFLDTFSQYGIDKPIDIPMGGPFAVWFSPNPKTALSYAGGVAPRTNLGINATALMVYEGSNIGPIEGTNPKEDGEGFVDRNGDTREFKDRLLGAVILVNNYRLD